MRLCPLLALCFAFHAIPAHAQMIDGRVMEAGTGDPVAAVFIEIVPEGRDRAIATTLSRRDGRFQLRDLLPGDYTLRARRIGFGSTSAQARVEGDGRTLVELRLAAEAVRLEQITVEADRRCRPHAARGPEMALLWEAARSAVQGTEETAEAGAIRFTVASFERELGASGEQVLEQRERVRPIWGSNPIRSLSAERLSNEGYIQSDPAGDIYYGPDAAVLLSDAFLEDHCFHIAEDPDAPALVGLAFEPVRGQTLPGITGTLWVDRATAELDHLDYHYINLPHRISSNRIGGRIEFERLSTGAWVVGSWWIRMPNLIAREHRGRQDLEITGYRQVGGEIRQIEIAGRVERTRTPAQH